MLHAVRHDPAPITDKRSRIMEYTIREEGNKMRNPIDVNKIELVDFHKLFDKIWTEDITDEDEMMFFKFYKAGVNIHKEYYRKLESYCEKLEKDKEIAVEILGEVLQDADSLYMQLQHAQDNPPPTVNYFKKEKEILRKLRSEL